MVESRPADDDYGDYAGYPDEGPMYDPYLQDADILDRPDLFYGEDFDALGWLC